MKLETSALLLILAISNISSANTTKIIRIPTPETVSEALQLLVSGPPTPFWNNHPPTNTEWNSWVNNIAQQTLADRPFA